MIRFVRRDRSSPMKKNAFIRFHCCNAHYYVIISHNTSVPIIGHLELATGTLTSHASWVWLIKMYPWSHIFLRCIRVDLDLIVNEFKQIGLIRLLIWTQPFYVNFTVSACLSPSINLMIFVYIVCMYISMLTFRLSESLIHRISMPISPVVKPVLSISLFLGFSVLF